MDNGRLKQIRSSLSALPVLEGRLNNLQEKSAEAEENLNRLKSKYQKEMRDVEKLHEKSFTVSLLQVIGRYEGKLTKESQEQLAAKMEYDKANSRVDELKADLYEISDRIRVLKEDQRQYEIELNNRREDIKRSISNVNHERYVDLDRQIGLLLKQTVEVDEAARAASRVFSTAQRALDSLDSAEGWATYDVWGGRGILSHAAKYGAVDDAEAAMNILDDQLKDLQKELSDIHLQESFHHNEIDSTTRAVDFWFDNIFTDMNVRSMIRENRESLVCLCEKINDLNSTLEQKKNAIHKNIDALEREQDTLLFCE